MEDTDQHYQGPQADVILRSVDGHDFRFHKYILSLASPVFDTMFALSQPPSPPGQGNTTDGLAVVKLADKRQVLQKLLGMYHPGFLEKDGKIVSVDEWKELLNAANKYEMKDVVQSLLWSLESFAEAEPIRVYGLAIKHGLEDVARKAAFDTLRKPFGEWDLVPELEYMTGSDLQRLFGYHVACGKLASSTIRSCRHTNILVGSTFCWYTCVSRSRVCKCSGVWWQSVVDELAVAFEKKPRGGVEEGHDLIIGALLAASDCNICRSKAPADMEMFKHAIVTNVDEAILSQIKLEGGQPSRRSSRRDLE